MSYTRFHLENPRNEDLSYVRCTVKLLHGQYYRFYISGEKVNAQDWDNKNQKVKKSCWQHYSINRMLDRLRYKIDEERRRLFSENNLTKWEMQKFVDGVMGKNTVSFYALWDQLIEEKKLQTTTSSKNKLPDKYENIKKKLKAYDPKLTFSDITLDWMHRWIAWLYDEYDLSTNTVARYVKFFKTFMSEMQKRGYHDNVGYKSFSIKMKEVLHPYLTIDELNILYHKRFREQALENARINLLIGCYSGQRHSDWHKITNENMMTVDHKPYYHIAQTKTKQSVLIPAHDKLMSLVNTDHYPLSNQKLNGYIKDVCKEAGIDGAFVKPLYKGSQVSQMVYKKYELASSHIARRSFVCNALKQGVSTEIIMRVGGWRSYSSFRQYVHLSSADGLDQLDSVF